MINIESHINEHPGVDVLTLINGMQIGIDHDLVCLYRHGSWNSVVSADETVCRAHDISSSRLLDRITNEPSIPELVRIEDHPYIPNVDQVVLRDDSVVLVFPDRFVHISSTDMNNPDTVKFEPSKITEPDLISIVDNMFQDAFTEIQDQLGVAEGDLAGIFWSDEQDHITQEVLKVFRNYITMEENCGRA